MPPRGHLYVGRRGHLGRRPLGRRLLRLLQHRAPAPRVPRAARPDRRGRRLPRVHRRRKHAPALPLLPAGRGGRRVAGGGAGGLGCAGGAEGRAGRGGRLGGEEARSSRPRFDGFDIVQTFLPSRPEAIPPSSLQARFHRSRDSAVVYETAVQPTPVGGWCILRPLPFPGRLLVSLSANGQDFSQPGGSLLLVTAPRLRDVTPASVSPRGGVVRVSLEAASLAALEGAVVRVSAGGGPDDVIFGNSPGSSWAEDVAAWAEGETTLVFQAPALPEGTRPAMAAEPVLVCLQVPAISGLGWTESELLLRMERFLPVVWRHIHNRELSTIG